jgi:predicted transcriptional regulator
MRQWYDTPMSTERVTITLPADVIAQLDEIAEARGLSRSGVVREASTRYIAGEREQDRAAQLATATTDLLGFLDELQSAPVLDDRPVLEILRELRGGPLQDRAARDDAAPR